MAVLVIVMSISGGVGQQAKSHGPNHFLACTFGQHPVLTANPIQLQFDESCSALMNIRHRTVWQSFS